MHNYKEHIQSNRFYYEENTDEITDIRKTIKVEAMHGYRLNSGHDREQKACIGVNGQYVIFRSGQTQ